MNIEIRKNNILNNILEADKNGVDIYPLTLELNKILPVKYWNIVDDMLIHWEWGHPVDTWITQLRMIDLSPKF